MTAPGRLRVVTLVAVGACLLALATPFAAGAAKREHRVPWLFAEGPAAQARAPNSAPPGSNRWGCDPTKRHPQPVVLVHGFLANRTVNWQTVSPYLANRGFCVFALTYGTRADARFPRYQPGGLRRMQSSARELRRFVNRVLRRTGADQVDIVGHSEGSLMSNWYVKFLGGKRKVDDYVGMTPLWDGTTLGGLSAIDQIATAYGLSEPVHRLFDSRCGACRQLVQGSRFLERMNSGRGPAVPGVDYTMIMTRNDQLVIPYTSGMMRAPNARNFVVQDVCGLDQADHVSVAADPVTAGLVHGGLDRRAPDPPCTVVLPSIGAPGYRGR